MANPKKRKGIIPRLWEEAGKSRQQKLERTFTVTQGTGTGLQYTFNAKPTFEILMDIFGKEEIQYKTNKQSKTKKLSKADKDAIIYNLYGLKGIQKQNEAENKVIKSSNSQTFSDKAKIFFKNASILKLINLLRWTQAFFELSGQAVDWLFIAGLGDEERPSLLRRSLKFIVSGISYILSSAARAAANVLEAIPRFIWKNPKTSLAIALLWIGFGAACILTHGAALAFIPGMKIATSAILGSTVLGVTLPAATTVTSAVTATIVGGVATGEAVGLLDRVGFFGKVRDFLFGKKKAFGDIGSTSSSNKKSEDSSDFDTLVKQTEANRQGINRAQGLYKKDSNTSLVSLIQNPNMAASGEVRSSENNNPNPLPTSTPSVQQAVQAFYGDLDEIEVTGQMNSVVQTSKEKSEQSSSPATTAASTSVPADNTQASTNQIVVANTTTTKQNSISNYLASVGKTLRSFVSRDNTPINRNITGSADNLDKTENKNTHQSSGEPPKQSLQ